MLDFRGRYPSILRPEEHPQGEPDFLYTCSPWKSIPGRKIIRDIRSRLLNMIKTIQSILPKIPTIPLNTLYILNSAITSNNYFKILINFPPAAYFKKSYKSVIQLAKYKIYYYFIISTLNVKSDSYC